MARLLKKMINCTVVPRTTSVKLEIEHMPGLLCICDTNGEITDCNKSFRDAFPKLANIFSFLFHSHNDNNAFLLNEMKFSDEWERIMSVENDYIQKANSYHMTNVHERDPLYYLLDTMNSTRLKKVKEMRYYLVKTRKNEKGYIVYMQDITNIILVAETHLRVVNSYLPTTIVRMMYQKENIIKNASRHHDNVTILFADIVDFTTMSSHVEAHEVMELVSDIFERFDSICTHSGVYKYETVGDCYVVVLGLMDTFPDGSFDYLKNTQLNKEFAAKNAIRQALKMLYEANSLTMPYFDIPVKLRVGIHSGPIMSGIVSKTVPKLCLFGDTINFASRMQTTSIPNTIQISEATYKLLGPELQENFVARLNVEIKGKGTCNTWVWQPFVQRDGMPESFAKRCIMRAIHPMNTESESGLECE